MNEKDEYKDIVNVSININDIKR
jgi:hypothetical protein